MFDAGAKNGSTEFDPAVMGWLTVELAAYGAAALLALALRLLVLGIEPLGAEEAAQALPALATSMGSGFAVGGVSPLLLSLQRVLFGIFGANEVTARFWPALLGGLAPLLFLGLRRPLGRDGALAAAYLWAISPIVVFATRLGLGYGLSPTLALAIVAGVAIAEEGDLEQKRTSRLGLLMAAGALGLLLASGTGAYTMLVVGVSAGLVWRRSLPRVLDALRVCGKQVAGAFFICFVAGSTLFLIVPEGLAAAADLLGSWLSGLQPGAGEYGTWEIGLRLLLSEPLLLIVGLVGIGLALKRREPFGVFSSVFAGIAILLPLIGRGRHPADLALTVLPLTLLSGPVVARCLRSAWSARHEVDFWLLTSVTAILLLAAAFSLPGIFNASNSASWRQLYMAIGIVTVALAGLLWVVYGVWGSWRTVAIGIPLIVLLLGLIWNLGQVSALNYDHGAWRQAGVLHEKPAPALADLKSEVLALASLHGAGKGESSIDLVLPQAHAEPLAPLLRWALRDHANLRLAESVSASAAPVVITLPGEHPRLDALYSGTEVTVLQGWKPASLTDFYSRLRWVLYRESRQLVSGRSVVLWMRRPELPSSTLVDGGPANGAPVQPGMAEE